MRETRPPPSEALRPPQPHSIGSGGDAAADPNGTVQVTWGALIDDLELVGMTVGEALGELQTAYNIAPGVQINVNGVEAGEETVLSEGDALEFVRAAGEKGVR